MEFSPIVPKPNGPSIEPAGVYRDTFRTYARYAPRLLVIGAAIFVPLGFLEAIVGRIDTIDSASVGELTIAAILILVLLQVVLGLLGEVFYSGAVSVLIALVPPDSRFSLRWVGRRLAYGSLIGVDLTYNLGVAAGLLALVVPGVLVFTWFALAAPLVELEGHGARQALARSRALVRGRFWAVLAVLGPMTLAAQSVDDAVLAFGQHLFGDALLADWLSHSAANVIFSPIYAIPAALITLRLIGQPRPGDQAAN